MDTFHIWLHHNCWKHFRFDFLTQSKELRPTMSHINYWDQVNSWKNLWKFLNGPLCGNKSGPFPLLNVAAYWQSSDTEACAKKLSQIPANNVDNGGRGIGLRIYVRYCRFLGIFNFILQALVNIFCSPLCFKLCKNQFF